MNGDRTSRRLAQESDRWKMQLSQPCCQQRSYFAQLPGIGIRAIAMPWKIDDEYLMVLGKIKKCRLPYATRNSIAVNEDQWGAGTNHAIVERVLCNRESMLCFYQFLHSSIIPYVTSAQVVSRIAPSSLYVMCTKM